MPCWSPKEQTHCELHAMTGEQRARCQRRMNNMNITYCCSGRKNPVKYKLLAFGEEVEFQHETTFQTWFTHPITRLLSVPLSPTLARRIHTKVCAQTQTRFVSVNSGLFSLNGRAAANVGISQMKWATAFNHSLNPHTIHIMNQLEGNLVLNLLLS